MSLTPVEATPRALALITIAHELYSSDNVELTQAQFDDALVASVLSSDDDADEIDWRAIALALAMVGHLLIDTIPETMYAAAEETLARVIAQREGGVAGDYRVSIKNRLSGSALLQTVSLQVAQMHDDDA